MVGFNLTQRFDLGDFIVIYIPLWSDSIRTERTWIPSRICIYIPLWSDSIARFKSESCMVELFTFHYGRIQSRLSRISGIAGAYLHSIMVGFNPVLEIKAWEFGKFTFHYGRIQSRTLFAFFQRKHIYIPLWSDSIPLC